MSPILRRPSIAVTAWGLLMIGAFAWRGDLRLECKSDKLGAGSPAANSSSVGSLGPVVVRRPNDNVQLPHARRSGRVYDSLGYLIVGADVVAADVVAPKDGSSAVRTGSDGSFELQLPKQQVCDVLVRAEGRRSVWQRTTAIAPDDLTVRLEPSAPWDEMPQPPSPDSGLRGEGLVLDQDGRPLGGGFVNVVGTQCWAQTNDIGRYELALPSIATTLRVQAARGSGSLGGWTALSAPFVSSRERGVIPLPELTVAAAGSIRGLVRDASGKPIADQPVRVRGAGFERTVATNDAGVFVAAGLPAAEFSVEPFAYRGAVAAPVQLTVNQVVVACDLELQPIEDVVLKVVDRSSAALAGLWVSANHFGLRTGVGQTDANGEVRLPIVASTSFEVRTTKTFAAFDVIGFEADADKPTLVVAMQ